MRTFLRLFAISLLITGCAKGCSKEEQNSPQALQMKAFWEHCQRDPLCVQRYQNAAQGAQFGAIPPGTMIAPNPPATTTPPPVTGTPTTTTNPNLPLPILPNSISNEELAAKAAQVKKGLQNYYNSGGQSTTQPMSAGSTSYSSYAAPSSAEPPRAQPTAKPAAPPDLDLVSGQGSNYSGSAK